MKSPLLPIPENLSALLQERDRVIDTCLPYLEADGRKVLQEYLMDAAHEADIWVALRKAQELVLAVLKDTDVLML